MFAFNFGFILATLSCAATAVIPPIALSKLGGDSRIVQHNSSNDSSSVTFACVSKHHQIHLHFSDSKERCTIKRQSVTLQYGSNDTTKQIHFDGRKVAGIDCVPNTCSAFPRLRLRATNNTLSPSLAQLVNVSLTNYLGVEVIEFSIPGGRITFPVVQANAKEVHMPCLNDSASVQSNQSVSSIQQAMSTQRKVLIVNKVKLANQTKSSNKTTPMKLGITRKAPKTTTPIAKLAKFSTSPPSNASNITQPMNGSLIDSTFISDESDFEVGLVEIGSGNYEIGSASGNFPEDQNLTRLRAVVEGKEELLISDQNSTFSGSDELAADSDYEFDFSVEFTLYQMPVRIAKRSNAEVVELKNDSLPLLTQLVNSNSSSENSTNLIQANQTKTTIADLHNGSTPGPNVLEETSRDETIPILKYVVPSSTIPKVECDKGCKPRKTHSNMCAEDGIFVLEYNVCDCSQSVPTDKLSVDFENKNQPRLNVESYDTAGLSAAALWALGFIYLGGFTIIIAVVAGCLLQYQRQVAEPRVILVSAPVPTQQNVATDNMAEERPETSNAQLESVVDN